MIDTLFWMDPKFLGSVISSKWIPALLNKNIMFGGPVEPAKYYVAPTRNRMRPATAPWAKYAYGMY